MLINKIVCIKPSSLEQLRKKNASRAMGTVYYDPIDKKLVTESKMDFHPRALCEADTAVNASPF